jgi:hypothetical protein
VVFGDGKAANSCVSILLLLLLLLLLLIIIIIITIIIIIINTTKQLLPRADVSLLYIVAYCKGKVKAKLSLCFK